METFEEFVREEKERHNKYKVFYRIYFLCLSIFTLLIFFKVITREFFGEYLVLIGLLIISISLIILTKCVYDFVNIDDEEYLYNKYRKYKRTSRLIEIEFEKNKINKKEIYNLDAMTRIKKEIEEEENEKY